MLMEEGLVENYYRHAYSEIIHHFVQAINLRFNQYGYKVICTIMICFAADYVFTPYADDLDEQVLALKLCVLHCNLAE